MRNERSGKFAKSSHSMPPFYIWEGLSDFTRKTGRYPAVIGSVEGVELWESGTMEELPSSTSAEVLVQGPFFDIMTAGTDFIVRAKVRDFLATQTTGTFDFVPVELHTRNGTRVDEDYYAVRFLKSVPARLDALAYDFDLIAKCPYRAMMAYCSADDYIYSRFVQATLAEKMIAEGFTGLGFENPFGSTRLNAFCCHTKQNVGHDEKPSPAVKRLEKLQQIALQSTGIREGWEQLLAYCSTPKTETNWKQLQKVPVEQDLAKARKWLSGLIAKDPPPATVRAFWFGLFDAWENEMEVPKLYVSGSTKYRDEEKYDIEWAIAPRWKPKGRYFNSLALESIARFANENRRFRSKAMYTAVLGYALLLVRFALEAPTMKAEVQRPKKTARRGGRV